MAFLLAISLRPKKEVVRDQTVISISNVDHVYGDCSARRFRANRQLKLSSHCRLRHVGRTQAIQALALS